MTNDDRSNEDRTGDGQVPNWGEPQQPSSAAADEPRYGERAPQAEPPRYGERTPEGETQYGAPQYGSQQDGSAQNGSPQYGSAQNGSPQYGSAQNGSPQYGSPQYGSQQYGEQQGQYGQPQYGQPEQGQHQYGQQPYAAASAPASAGAPSWQGYEEPKAKKKTLGVVAFIVAVLALVVAVIGGYLFGAAFGGSDAFRQSIENGGATPSDADIMALTTSSSAVIGSVLFYLGTALGLWAIVQGIVAAITKRGRGWGVFAIILAVVAAIAFVVTILIAAVAASGMS
ncbi:hypothetical protein EDF64_103246 [Curtobacterium flaccumfaciens]|uniref:DUF4064 domain-containing protein n=1 Tax=Curtobacterium flaccumfaciens TaxID=2035 RepID=A0A4V3BL81_9MICO|nr:DUF4064 domain-containing protein [Curtobacterium flaccumfaciens]TDN45322.1 hypothetical protein EDF64_103246 [Curtobacterium flaccumfaciens]